MMKKLQLVFLFLFAISYSTIAQNKEISGKISGDDGIGLPGVSISIKGTTKGTNTDADGRFKLSVTPKAKLVLSFIGYQTKTVEVGESNTLTVQLESSLTDLDEVIVSSGYGSTVRKKELTGATSIIKGDVIENMPIQSFDRALQGRMSGVRVSSNNGTPGGAVSIRIRGVGSISAGNEPLYIVDGVQVNTSNDGGGRVSSNPLSFLNPNDIETIDVLKDAATAAIYGAQAANGVVLITTKKGKAGKTQLGFNYYKGITEPVPTLGMLNTQDFIQARIEALTANSPTTPAATIRGNTLAQIGLNRELSDADIAALPTYDWQKEAYKQGQIDNYELTAQGGTGKTTFYTSFSYNKQDASLINIDFSRITARFKINNQLTKRLSMELGANLSNVKQNGPFGNSEATTAFGAPQYSAPIILPINPIYNTDGSFFGLPDSGVVMPGDLSQNVIASSEYIKSSGNNNQAVGNLSLTYTLSPSMFLRASGGLDYRNIKTIFYGDARLSDYNAIRGSLSEAVTENNNYNTNITFNYNKTFKKHTVGGLAGFEYRSDVSQGTSFNGVGFPSPDFNTANAAAEPSSIGGFWTGVKRAGVFSSLSYDFSKKYILKGIVRYDGSSRFGANNQWGFFPSLSSKWIISEENFLKDSRFVSDLGIRLSAGSTGNDQVSNFASRRLYGLNGVYAGNSGIGPSSLGNANLKWERNITYNAGIDYGFFKGKIKGAIDLFQRTSKDILLTRSIPTTNGFGSVFENIGEVVNKGIEFEINTVNIDRNKFLWETNFNFTLLRNEVTKLFDGVDVLPGDLSVRVGYPLGTNIGVPYAGVNPANGRPMWLDLNDDLIYLVRTADNRPLGHSNIPKSFGGFTNTFSYAGFEVSAFIQYDLGRTALNGMEFRLADNGAVLRNSLKSIYDNRWTTPGQISEVPRPAENRTQISGRVSSYQSASRFYQDASYVRLKQVNFSYNIPKKLLSPLKIEKANIYFQAINLLTWTKWRGFDPEFVGSNEGIVPTSRSFTSGIQIGL